MQRPFKTWPTWLLQKIVTIYSKRPMWSEAYLELMDRANDYARSYATRHPKSFAVHPITDIN